LLPKTPKPRAELYINYMVEATGRVIGILKEGKNKWERRCSITPNEVKVLV